jgi:hypothetical protein
VLKKYMRVYVIEFEPSVLDIVLENTLAPQERLNRDLSLGCRINLGPE